MKTNKLLISEKILERYYQLKQEKKLVEDELKTIRELILTHFDFTDGVNVDAQTQAGSYLARRVIRKQEKYDEEKTVHTLEQLNLHDCIRTIRQPDQEKINSALTLELIQPEDLQHCVIKKYTSIVYVDKM